MIDTIIKIQPSDLISDSMSKINRNFEIISNRDDVTESKLNQWAENIENKLADIRNENGIINDVLLNNVQRLENKIDNLTDLDGITKEVQNIFNNATIDVENLINDKADEAISSKLGDYVKTSTLNERLDGYVASTAFDTYRSDSSKSFAQSSRIVANSKFLKLPNGGVDCLVKSNGEITEFKSVEDYFKSLSASEKTEILGDKTFGSDDEALEDPDVIANLIKKCEKTFKTVISEMSVISQTVGPDNVENTIITTVRDGETGKDITASIFTKANEKGSLIALNADKILIDSKHALNVKSGGNINIESGGKFQISSNNFNIDEDGIVRVKGTIEATSLKITGSNGLVDISDETKLSKFVKEHQDTVSGDVGWLKEALNGGTTIDGGLVLSNAILTKDGADNITAGMIGSNTSENDIRFFAGPKYILSPTTKQKLICVKDTTNENNPSQIFVRYPSLDKKSTGQHKDKYVYELWDKDSYDYYDDRNKFQYYSTFEYNGSTYYMWKLVGDNIVILTEERDYTTNNLKYHNNNFSLTPKIVAFLRNDEEYTHNEANLTYIVATSSDSIYVDQFYNAYAWVLDSNSEGVSLYDYHNSSGEQLDTGLVIYTDSENVNINDILGIQISSTESLSYKVIDVSPSQSDAIKQSSFKVYEDGKFEAIKGRFGCLEIGVEKLNDSKTSILEGTIYENNNSYLSPYEISGLGSDEYYTHYIKMSPEIFQINAYRGDNIESESVRILPLRNLDKWDSSGLVEINARSDEATAIYVKRGTIESDYFRSYKIIATSASNNDYCHVETVMSNLCGLNIAFIVSDKTKFKFKFDQNDDTDQVRYKLDIYLNDMKILTNGSGHFENSLTEDEKNSISVDTNISYDNGIWRYKNTSGNYKNIFGCYTTSFDKSLQPNTLFIQLGTNGNNGSIYLGNIKIVG